MSLLGGAFSVVVRVAVVLLAFFACAIDGRVLANDVPQKQIVVTEGAGKDLEGARKDACRQAVQQIINQNVATETILANDRVIADRILSQCEKFIDKVEVLAGSERKEQGIVRARVKADVQVTQLLDELRAQQISTGARSFTRPIDGGAVAAEVASKANQQETQASKLAEVLQDYPESCLSVAQVGKETVEQRTDGKTVLSIPLAITPNDGRYDVFAKELCAALSTAKRRSGEFKNDGGNFGPEPDAQRHRDSFRDQLERAFTDSKSMLGVFPPALQEQVRRSCDEHGQSSIAGMGRGYLLWDGQSHFGVPRGLQSLNLYTWQELRVNRPEDWIVICMTSAKKDHRMTSWKWFHVTEAEYRQWFANVPQTFRCKIELLDKNGGEVAEDEVELSQIGALRRYNRLLWCVPMYVNLNNTHWYTPELRLVRSVEIDAEDAASIAAVRVSIERGTSASR